MTDVTEQLTGIIPTVVTAGVVMKVSDRMLGNPAVVKETKKKKKLTSTKKYYNNPLA